MSTVNLFNCVADFPLKHGVQVLEPLYGRAAVKEALNQLNGPKFRVLKVNEAQRVLGPEARALIAKVQEVAGRLKNYGTMGSPSTSRSPSPPSTTSSSSTEMDQLLPRQKGRFFSIGSQSPSPVTDLVKKKSPFFCCCFEVMD